MGEDEGREKERKLSLLQELSTDQFRISMLASCCHARPQTSTLWLSGNKVYRAVLGHDASLCKAVMTGCDRPVYILVAQTCSLNLAIDYNGDKR